MTFLASLEKPGALEAREPGVTASFRFGGRGLM